MALIAPGTLDLYHSLLTTTLAAVVFAAVYAYRSNLANIFITLGLFVGSLVFLPTTDYIFNSILKQHQRDRILSFLGIISDPLGTDYNVNQAKIAIGSGNFWGKGFLEGTQIKYGFVPEKHTDFIFCTVGEEEGFIGSAGVLLLFLVLILRLLALAERQPFAFGRIYGYCVASVFLFHVFINVGMVLGLTPVIGIPLPFFSYGGSSLWGFTILLFIFLSIDAKRNMLKA
jgi:rod shape determining protein RodA